MMVRIDVFFSFVQVCPDEGECREGSHFSVLGGSAEMPWSFDRLYKMEITQILKDMKLSFDSHFTIKTKIVAHNGTDLAESILPEATIIRIPPSCKYLLSTIILHTFALVFISFRV